MALLISQGFVIEPKPRPMMMMMMLNDDDDDDDDDDFFYTSRIVRVIVAHGPHRRDPHRRMLRP